MTRLGDDFKLRLLSVLIAVVLWVYVVNAQNPEMKRDFENIPVTLQNIDLLTNHGLVISSDNANITTVKLKGKQEEINKIQRNDIEAIADLKNVTKKMEPGKVTIPVKVMVLSSEGVQVVGKNNYSINIELDKFAQVQKSVEVSFVGEDNKDIKHEVKSIKPNTVTLSGPEKLISKIDSVKVSVDVTNVQREISVIKKFKIFTKTNIDLTNDKRIVKDAQSAQIEVDYNRFKTVPVMLKVEGTPAKGYKISNENVEPDSIIIFGHTSQVEKVNEIFTKKINISGLKQGVEKDLEPIIPVGVKTDFMDNIKARIIIEKESKITNE